MKDKKDKFPRGQVYRILRGKAELPSDPEEIDAWYYQQSASKEEINAFLKEVKPSDMLSKIKKNASIKNTSRSFNLISVTSIAASILLFFTLGALYFLFFSDYTLNQSKLAYKEVITHAGERKKGLLPDGSTVILKENSKITYPENFLDNRTVKLEGEAFFEVKRNGRKPFIVQATSLETTVLGTQFLVSDKKGKSEMVLVKSGKVSVAKINSSLEKSILEKGQKAKLNKSGNLELFRDVNEEKYFAWTEGTLVIEEANAFRIAKEISDWYGIEVINKVPDNSCLISGAYHKMSLEEVLETINYSVTLKYKLDDKKLTIYELTCKN